MEEKYSEGNVVWVKLKGYPWWPGVVSINKNKQKYINNNRFKKFYLHKNI